MAQRLSSASVLASAAFALPVSAQTWAGNRDTPALRELVAVDQTGEPNWLFGSEDVAGDGPASFDAAEQAADLRSGYAATDRERLWLRVYVSAQTAPDELRAFVFIDTDDQPSTGGTARAPEVDAALDTEAATAGYDVVLTWTGAGPLALWRWVDPNGAGRAGSYQAVPELEPVEPRVELGADLDPLRLNAPENGYIQASLNFDPLDLGVACAAKLLLRSTSGTLRDRDLGRAGPCVAGDGNANDVSDLAETTARCSSDAQCPGGGSCSEGLCTAPTAAAAPGDGLVTAPGELVQGGAFTCSSAHPPALPGSSWWSVPWITTLLGASQWRRLLGRRRAVC